jgi:urease accessory protein
MLDLSGNDTQLQRARGRAAVTLSLRDGATVVARLAQAGAAKALLPRVHGGQTEVVFLNTAGGLAGGDRHDLCLTLAPGTSAVATTQTAERAYRSLSSPACVRVTLTVGAGARLDWLPQETILYDAAALDRRTRVDLAGDGSVLLAETIFLGRVAMGETVTRLELADRREVWSRGRPVWIDRLALGTETLAPRAALLDGARAFATIALIGQGAEDALGPLRAALNGCDGIRAAASGWDGKCIMRLTGLRGMDVKRAVAVAATVLRQGAPLPRVWQR